ncbi:MAG: O-antigen ligase family protein [Sporolactobacillus sp.]
MEEKWKVPAFEMIVAAALLAGFAVVLAVGDWWIRFIFLCAWLCAALAVTLVLQERANRQRIMIGWLYVLIGSAFLNQTLLNVHIGFVTLFVYRLAMIGCLVSFIALAVQENGLKDRWRSSHVQLFLLFFLVWFADACLSLTWALSLTEGLKYVLLLGMGIAFVLLAALTFQRMEEILFFFYLWLFMSALLIAIGLGNHFFRIQLPTSSLYGGSAYKLAYPTAVFTNQNDFATLLSLSFFFFLAYAASKPPFFRRALAWSGSLLSLWLIVLTESRASELGIAAGLVVYVFLLLPSRRRRAALWIAGVAMLAGLLLLHGPVAAKFTKYTTFEMQYSLNDVSASDVVRTRLIESAAGYLTNSAGMGTGAGNLAYYLKTQPLINTNHINEAHNWFAEITATFGVFVGIGYLAVYLALFFSLFRYAGGRHAMLVKAALTAQAAFFVSSISPSSISNLYFHWLLLGFLLALLAVLRNEDDAGRRRRNQ